jgi:hypothetical protein
MTNPLRYKEVLGFCFPLSPKMAAKWAKMAGKSGVEIHFIYPARRFKWVGSGGRARSGRVRVGWSAGSGFEFMRINSIYPAQGTSIVAHAGFFVGCV